MKEKKIGEIIQNKSNFFQKKILFFLLLSLMLCPLPHFAQKKHINHSGESKQIVIKPQYVLNSDGTRHAYYSGRLIQKYFIWKMSFFPKKNGGYYSIVIKNRSYRIYFLLNHRQYKIQHTLMNLKWPILAKDNYIYLPKEMLHYVLPRLYVEKIAWQQDNLIIFPNINNSPNSEKKIDPNISSPSGQMGLSHEKDTKKISDKKKQTQNKYRHNLRILIKNIVIDPGHGGRDPGAIFGRGRNSVQEKKIVLKFAKQLGKALKKANPDLRVFITRNNDKFVSLERRTEMANHIQKKYGGTLFLSIHVNSSLSSRTKGIEIFYLNPNANNEESRYISALEKDKKKQKNDYRNNILFPAEFFLYNAQLQKESQNLAQSLTKQINKLLSQRITSRGIKRADFVVLRGTLMPAVLIEIGFITNPTERKLLQNPQYLKKLKNALVKGTLLYIQKYNQRK